MNGMFNWDPSEGQAIASPYLYVFFVVTIPLTLEDELSDIPPEMRATVAEEIKAFRDRSNRRDIERMRREEELEQADVIVVQCLTVYVN